MKSWISQAWATLLSALSWTHWRQKKAMQRWEMEQRLLLQMRLQHRMLLMEALTPMAEALQRLDNLQRQGSQQQYEHLKYLEELLMEVLNSLQPPVSQQIFPRTGQPMQRATSPNSES